MKTDSEKCALGGFPHVGEAFPKGTTFQDSIFYRLFKEFPSIFFELIGNSPQTADVYEFSSVEIKQTAFRIDGVFLPTQGEENPIYFVEVQFQTEE